MNNSSKNSETLPGPKTLEIGFILAPGFTLLAFTGFMEVLRHAADIGDLSRQIMCRWTIMGSSLVPVKSSCGIEVTPWETFKDPDRFDYIVVVGGLLAQMGQISSGIIRYLKLASAAGTPLVGLCTGSFVLAKAGLMNNRRCVIHWYHYQEFKNLYPKADPVLDELYVIDGDRLTAPGGTAVIDLALAIVEKHLGSERVMKALRHLILDWSRPPDHPQTPYMNDYSLIRDPRVRKTVFLMEKSLAEPLSLNELAKEVHTSPRQLERLFQTFFKTSPALYFRNLRLKQANWLLTNTDTPITSIALDCGFTDSSHFAKRFKDFYGCSPSELRRRFKTKTEKVLAEVKPGL